GPARAGRRALRRRRRARLRGRHGQGHDEDRVRRARPAHRRAPGRDAPRVARPARRGGCADRRATRLPLLRQALEPRLQRRDHQGEVRLRAGRRAGVRRPLRPQAHRRARAPRARDRGERAGQRQPRGLAPRRDRLRGRVVRLRHQVRRGPDAPGVPGAGGPRADRALSRARDRRVPRDRLLRHGPGGLLPGRHRRDPRERDQHHPGVHLDERLRQDVGGHRPLLSRRRAAPRRPLPGASPGHVEVANTGAPGPIVIAGGGTGGHTSPGLAVATILKARGVPHVWIGSRDGVEARRAPEQSITYYAIPTGKLRRYWAWRNVSDLAVNVPAGVWSAHRLVRRLRPRVVLATGGFVALPVVAGAALARVPIVVHEQTAVPGLANRIAARLARRVAVSFADSAHHFPAARVVVTGNPLRQDLRAGSRADAVARFGLDPTLPLVYVTGGALGARAINRAVGAIVGDLLSQAQVIHQCGDNRETGDLAW